MIIVIDGPAGSGKSSTAKQIAQKTGLVYLDSGALYRAVALLYIECKEEQTEFDRQLKESKLRFEFESDLFKVWLNSNEVTHLLRKPEVSAKVSVVAAQKHVRAFVNYYLRIVVNSGSFIADGRDLATVVFPDADLKVFMTASVAKRAKRRLDELTASGINAEIEEIEENIRSRDRIDSQRQEAPLKKDPQAVEIDTSNLTFDEQVDTIISLMREKGLIN
jgi:cytidylate kinase